MDTKTDTINSSRLPGSSEDEINLLTCPTCDKKLRRYEIFEHFEQEMELLRQMQMKAVNADVEQVESSTSEQVENDSGAEERRQKPWNIFQRIQRNRQSRLKQRTRKRPAAPLEQPCPICNDNYPQDEIQQHAEHCLRRSMANNTNGRDDNISSNDEYNDDLEEYEEYEWAGQKRIRVSSLLQGGYASIGIGQTTNHRQQEDEEDDEEDLNVDQDDTHIYGPAQYGESDVIPPKVEHNGSDNEEGDVTNYMRRLITGNTAQSVSSHNSNSENINDKANNAKTTHSIEVIIGPTTVTATTSKSTKSQQQHIIDALKAKLRHYENQVQNKFKCLICLDEYRNPAISVSCWHVHCEECWLRSLGARKLCPQCNLITTPKDLRRIYM